MTNCARPAAYSSESSSGSTVSTAATSSDELFLDDATVGLASKVTLAASGGTTPYQYRIVSGAGTLNLSSGVYTAGSVAASVTVKVTDADGTVATATITVQPNISLNLSTNTVDAGASLEVDPTGGVAPYTYSVISGGGTFLSNIYTAPSAADEVEIQVTDADGNVGTEDISIVDASGDDGTVGVCSAPGVRYGTSNVAKAGKSVVLSVFCPADCSVTDFGGYIQGSTGDNGTYTKVYAQGTAVYGQWNADKDHGEQKGQLWADCE